MAKCEVCGKKPQFGHNVSHSKQTTKRQWKPNIQTITVMVQGRPKKVDMCTNCLRTLNKKGKLDL